MLQWLLRTVVRSSDWTFRTRGEDAGVRREVELAGVGIVQNFFGCPLAEDFAGAR